MFKNFLCLLFFQFFFCFIILAQKPKVEIRAALLKNQNDWNSGNIEKYMEIYLNSDSLLFIGKSGPKYGYINTLNNYKNSYPDTLAMGILTFGIIRIEILGKNFAHVVGSWNLKRINDQPSGHFTLLMKKIKGRWLIITDHSS